MYGRRSADLDHLIILGGDAVVLSLFSFDIDRIIPQSSQFAEPLWTDPGVRRGISVQKLISTSEKKKKHRWGMNG